ncbi:hypothetical protein [Comamonas sp. GB3 AK4-5]|uniref:hypothetical protein n=1 Tax=Comamonas sp. GB3 AK4-5 TaxID=3231487 RepID=UPI00351F1218
MDLAFFGKVVPLAGLRRPPPPPGTQPVRASMYPRGPSQKPERLSDGRYLVTNWMTNRCGREVQIGATAIYVVNDYGVMVLVESWGDQC